MKKYFSFVIASLLMATPMFLSSCGDDDDHIPDDNQEQVMTEYNVPDTVEKLYRTPTFMSLVE